MFPEIRTDTTVVGGPGLTVIAAKKNELDGGRTLTIAGDASSRFVFNLEEKVKLKDASSVVLTGACRVLFNVVGDKDSSTESGSSAAGTILSPFGKVKVEDAGSRLRGAAIAGGEVVVEGAGEISRPE